MIDQLDFLRDMSFLSVCIRIMSAAILGAVIGLERSRHGRAAGMRTHVLVSVGASLSVLIGFYCVRMGFECDPIRIAAQVVSGIGFLGAGIILVRNKTKIIGLTTAAGLWATAAIGLACGAGFYEGAVICFALELVTAEFMPKLENLFSKYDSHRTVYIEICEMSHANNLITKLYSEDFGNVFSVEIVSPKSGKAGNLGIMYTVICKKDCSVSEIAAVVKKYDDVVFTAEI